jgi:hypothetical protein
VPLSLPTRLHCGNKIWSREAVGGGQNEITSHLRRANKPFRFGANSQAGVLRSTPPPHSDEMLWRRVKIYLSLGP